MEAADTNARRPQEKGKSNLVEQASAGRGEIRTNVKPYDAHHLTKYKERADAIFCGGLRAKDGESLT